MVPEVSWLLETSIHARLHHIASHRLCRLLFFIRYIFCFFLCICGHNCLEDDLSSKLWQNTYSFITSCMYWVYIVGFNRVTQRAFLVHSVSLMFPTFWFELLSEKMWKTRWEKESNRVKNWRRKSDWLLHIVSPQLLVFC